MKQLDHPAPLDVVLVTQMYARQSHAIDNGDGIAWSETFTSAGEFRSPSYPAPVIGRGQLAEFGSRFRQDALAAGEARRHSVTDIHVQRRSGTGYAVRAYVSIIVNSQRHGTSIDRMVAIEDEVDFVDGVPLVARRIVSLVKPDLGPAPT